MNKKKNSIEKIFHSDQYQCYVNKKIKSLKSDINNLHVTNDDNEETIKERFNKMISFIFAKYFKHLGFTYSPKMEKRIKGSSRYSLVQGRADTAVGALIIEYKRPSKFHTIKMKKQALSQGIRYLHNINKTDNPKKEVFATDGISGGFYCKDETTEEFNQTAFTRISINDINKLVEDIIGSNQLMLSSNNLIRGFVSGAHPLAINLAQDLNNILQQKVSDRTHMLFTEWSRLFDFSQDDTSQQRDMKKFRKSLDSIFHMKPVNKKFVREYKSLFALQTAYAILIKIIAFKVISYKKYHDNLIQFSDFMTNNSTGMQYIMSKLEDGSIMREYGISNLLEGGLFSWYTDYIQDNREICSDIYQIADKLTHYQSTVDKFNTQDFFKNLYEKLIPKAVRHVLGEYYTPYWLANHVVKELITSHRSKNSHYSILDPTCGSGTFLTVAIKNIKQKGRKQNVSPEYLLHEILSRVIGIDINPLAALTSRVNYFLNISSLIHKNTRFNIPVYIGDSADIPKKVTYKRITLIRYTLHTKIKTIPFSFPAVALRDLKSFSDIMFDIETDINHKDSNGVYTQLMSLIPRNSLRNNRVIKKSLTRTTQMLILFKNRNWDGIWSRIIANYLSTACLHPVDYIVGNLPWVDWRNLPSKYRDKIKELPISKRIFSGDNRTGGINLNIAALILFASMKKWLKPTGAVGVLMPNTFMFQKTYEGFRHLEFDKNNRAYFYALDDWSKAGKPFSPVSQKFFTYYISRNRINYSKGIPVNVMVKRYRYEKTNCEHINVKNKFLKKSGYAIQTNSHQTNFTLTAGDIALSQFIGKYSSRYCGHQGVELYPKELMHFKFINNINKDMALLHHVTSSKDEYHINDGSESLEKKVLNPLIESTDVEPFHVNYSGLVVPFAYDPSYSKRYAISEKSLRHKAKNVYKYFCQNKSIFLKQTAYTQKRMIHTYKHAPFYSSARIGDYTFAPYTVVFRDNSSQNSAVVSKIKTPWGALKKPVFLKHAATITQRPGGGFISRSEAYYISGIFNCSVVRTYTKESVDSRSHPIKHVRFRIPLFNKNNKMQMDIAKMSHLASKHYTNKALIEHIELTISNVYITLLEFCTWHGTYYPLGSALI